MTGFFNWEEHILNLWYMKYIALAVFMINYLFTMAYLWFVARTQSPYYPRHKVLLVLLFWPFVSAYFTYVDLYKAIKTYIQKQIWKRS